MIFAFSGYSYMPALSTKAQGQTISNSKFKPSLNVSLVPSGISAIFRAIDAETIPLKSAPPIPMPGLPQSTKNLRFGTLHWQGHSYVFALGKYQGKNRLWLDSNHNGRFGDDHYSTTWITTGVKSPNSNESLLGYGFGFINIEFKGTVRHCRIGFYDLLVKSKTSGKMNPHEIVTAYTDFGFKGTIKVNGQTQNAYFQFPNLQSNAKSFSNGRMEIEYANSNRSNQSKAQFVLDSPFNLDGSTQIWTGISLKSGIAKFKRSSVVVPQINANSSPIVGQIAPKFNAEDMKGNLIHFPSDFRHKIVLLDFWATWQPESVAQLDQLSKIYQKYNQSGFDIIGISLDRADMQSQIAAICKTHNMYWPEIYDGKFWNATVGKKFDLKGLPFELLVNGSTGKIIADQNQLASSNLENTIRKSLGLSTLRKNQK